MASWNSGEDSVGLSNDHNLFLTTSNLQNYRFETARLSSFSKVDLSVSPLRLAQNGFFYDDDTDNITCFSCGVEKRHWTQEERQVAAIHLNISPDCLQAQDRDPRNVPICHSNIQHTAGPAGMRQTETESSGESREETRNPRSELSVSRHEPFLSTKSEAFPPSAQSNRVSVKDGSCLISFTQTASTESDGERTSNVGREFLMSASEPHLNGDTPLTNLEISSRESSNTLANSPQQPPTSELFRFPIQPVQAPGSFPDSTVYFGQPSSNGHQKQADDSVGDCLDTRRAASPANASVSARLSTFVDWPATGLPSPRSLVLAGFYYLGTGDSVRCFYCGVTLRNWRGNDDPWETHVRFRFSCDYVRAVKGENYIQHIQVKLATGRALSDPIEDAPHLDPRRTIASNVNDNTTPSADAAASRPDSTPGGDGNAKNTATRCNDSIQSTLSTGAQGINALAGGEVATTVNSENLSLGSAVEGLQSDAEQAPHTTLTEGSGTLSGMPSELQTTSVSPEAMTQTRTFVSTEHSSLNTTQQDDATYLQSLRETNQRLRRRVTCRLCRSGSVDTIFLPCGHLCTCETCAATVRDCCLCGRRIRGTAYVYMSE